MSGFWRAAASTSAKVGFDALFALGAQRFEIDARSLVGNRIDHVAEHELRVVVRRKRHRALRDRFLRRRAVERGEDTSVFLRHGRSFPSIASGVIVPQAAPPRAAERYDVTSKMTPTHNNSTYVSLRNLSWLIFFCSLLPRNVASTANGTQNTMIWTTSPVKCPC